jgi:hypothetical protein
MTDFQNWGFFNLKIKIKIALGIKNPNSIYMWNLNQNQHTLFKTRLELVMNI